MNRMKEKNKTSPCEEKNMSNKILENPCDYCFGSSKLDFKKMNPWN